MRQRKIIPGVDPKLLIKDAAKLMPDPMRRSFLRGAASLGALAFLTGCDIIDGDTAESVLRKISEVQRRRAGAAVQQDQAGADLPGKRDHAAVPVQRLLRRGRGAGGRSGDLQARGRGPRRQQEAVDARRAARAAAKCRRSRGTVCVEGWSAIGSWQGAVLSDFLKRIGADTRAKYVWFKCAEGYTNTIDMPTALHPQTQMTFKYDNKLLPRAYGFPMKIRMPTKLGYKNPKYVVAMEVTNTDPGGYWENQGYNWFGGL